MSKSDYCDLLHCHVWGCPVFILELKLQNYQNLPEYSWRAFWGRFFGSLDEQSSLVSNLRHISTGYIYPRFHLVFGGLFEMVILKGYNDSTI